MENDSSASDRATPPTADEARAALAGLGDDSARLSERIVTPPWYHPILGVCVAAFVIAMAIPGPLSSILLAIGIVALVALVIVYRQRYGISTSTPTGRGSRAILIAMSVLLLALMACALTIKLAELPFWWALPIAALAFVAIVMLGRRYDTLLRRDLAQHDDRRA